MRFVHASAQHIGARRSQQDSFGFSSTGDRAFLTHGGVLAVLCDGMGGLKHGDDASKTAVAAFLNAYHAKTPQETIPAALLRSVLRTNQEIVALAHELGVAEEMGTTLVAAAIHQGQLYYISVGDSGLFYVPSGALRLINRPHIFGNLLDKAAADGIISHQAAREHPEREALTSFIGAPELREIDQNVESMEFHPGDTILLASDGLFNTLTAEEMRAELKGDPKRWPDLLVARTVLKNREYQDNVTVLTLTLLPSA